MMKKRTYFTTAYLMILSIGLTGCGNVDGNSSQRSVTQSKSAYSAEQSQSGYTTEQIPDVAVASDSTVGAATVAPGKVSTPTASGENTSSRDNTPLCLVPTADGTAKEENDVAVIDYSHKEDGYVMCNYTGTCPKVKLRITGPDAIVYTYDLHGNGYETFPLSSGNGSYNVTIYENISGTSYATCLYAQFDLTLKDEFSPYLYPNQYVNFNKDSKTVKKGAELAKDASSDLEVVTNVYNYITSSIRYDYDKASDPPTGYTTDIDEILESGTGICLDYAAVMASMLRSQRIPTRLEVGYAKDAYHAWISVYIPDVGWLNGIIEFDGNVWTLVDPTFGANTDNKTLKKFIGDGSNYILQKMY